MLLLPREFLAKGQYVQREQDERVQLVQIVSVGGTNARAAGRIALSGSAEDIREFLEADQYTKDAEASATRAAASAKTARDAANRADVSTHDAARSAADATLSSETAQAAASNAAYYAEDARRSAVAAGKDADAALKAATDAFIVTVKKYREEEEARRKAAVAAKEKAKNDNGQRAAEIYRCQQGMVPCDPQDFARWCQQSEIACEIVANGKEFGDAMEQLWNAEKELLGLSQFEKCLQKKDFDNCKGVAIDALLSAKLKSLERVYDELKLLKRGCKIAGKAPLRSSLAYASATQAAGQGGLSCADHDVPGLPRSVSEIPGSSGCEVCARDIRDSLGGGEIFTILPTMSAYLPPYRGQESGWRNHVVVVYNDRVYDAWTGRGGETVSEFKSKWLWHDAIHFGF